MVIIMSKIYLLTFIIAYYYGVDADHVEDSDISIFSDKNQLRSFENVTLRKCYCSANEIWSDGDCLKANTSIDVVLFDPHFTIDKLKSESFLNVNISKVSCTEKEIPFELDGGVLQPSGVLMDRFNGETYAKHCVENVASGEGNDNVMVSYVCIPKFLEIPFCCPTEQYLDKSSLTCHKGEIKSLNLTVRMGPQILSKVEFSYFTQEIPKKAHNKQLIIFPCDNTTTLYYQNGNVNLVKWESGPMSTFLFRKDPSEYCIANSEDEFAYSAYIFWVDDYYYIAEDNSTTDVEEKCENAMHLVLLSLLAISTVFLVAILVLHIILPSLRKSIGSKIIMSHVASLLSGFFLLVLLQIPQYHYCKIYGPLIQFSFLAAFFWLNVMCFDIWWKLRCRCPAGESAVKRRKRFLYYSIYAWGCPMVLVVVTIAIDNIPSLEGNQWLITPGFDKGGNCWFADRNANYAYYFGVIALLMAFNLFFFLWVFVLLVNANCIYNQILNPDPSDNERAWIYLKIFCVMGVTWICEFFSWQEGTCTYWIATDIINSLRGLILFIIFFGSKKSINKIRERVTKLNTRFNSQLSRSMNNLRKLSRISSVITVESAVDSRRPSEVALPTSDLPPKIANHRSKDDISKLEKEQSHPKLTVVNSECKKDAENRGSGELRKISSSSITEAEEKDIAEDTSSKKINNVEFYV